MNGASSEQATDALSVFATLAGQPTQTQASVVAGLRNLESIEWIDGMPTSFGVHGRGRVNCERVNNHMAQI